MICDETLCRARQRVLITKRTHLFADGLDNCFQARSDETQHAREDVAQRQVELLTAIQHRQRHFPETSQRHVNHTLEVQVHLAVLSVRTHSHIEPVCHRVLSLELSVTMTIKSPINFSRGGINHPNWNEQIVHPVAHPGFLSFKAHAKHWLVLLVERTLILKRQHNDRIQESNCRKLNVSSSGLCQSRWNLRSVGH